MFSQTLYIRDPHQRVDSFVEGPMHKWAHGPRPAPLPYYGPLWLPRSTYLEEALEAAVCHIVYLCSEKCYSEIRGTMFRRRRACVQRSCIFCCVPVGRFPIRPCGAIEAVS